MSDCQNDKTNQSTTVVGVLYFATSTQVKVKNEGLWSITTSVQTKTSNPKYAFPTPEQSNNDQYGISSCTYDRVLNIYNKALGKSQKRLTETVEHWFIETAKKSGWADAMFINDCSAPKRTVCLLLSQAGLPYAATH